MNNTQKIILLSAISLSGISKAQQSQFFADKEQYRFNLAENLYQNKIYAASQYEFSRQYFYNQNLENSKNIRQKMTKITEKLAKNRIFAQFQV